jgi:AmmeMemoRadiSam system protein B/AmmeMemoRadiSam system protein A
MVLLRSILFLLAILPLAAVCNARNLGNDRQPAVAGQFYPAEADELGRLLDRLFKKAVIRKGLPNILAVLVPHAGYIYSGEVAASGFNQLDPDKAYDTVFILGPSHQVGFEGAAVSLADHFLTPLGPVAVNRELGEKLIKASPLFTARSDAQREEHSIEVEVPFLQHHLKKPFRIVPIVCGQNRPETCRKIGEVLSPFLNEKNLFVISTDFSHYPAYDDAVVVDKATGDAIDSNSPENLIKTIRRFEQSGIPNLVTPLCGASPVLTFLYMTSSDQTMVYHPIQYKNSGDMAAGDKKRVVGYHAIVVTRQAVPDKTSFELDPQDRKILLALARSTVERYVTTHSVPEPDPSALNGRLMRSCGAFVTLKKHGNLRGCIGRFNAKEPLYRVVQQMAISAATEDPRFAPVAASELPDLEIEISVLTPMRKINSIDEFTLGRQGIYIRKGLRAGTLLPQVARETGWTKEEFLGHCARDKAGIGWNGWKDADLYVYEAIVFGGT